MLRESQVSVGQLNRTAGGSWEVKAAEGSKRAAVQQLSSQGEAGLVGLVALLNIAPPTRDMPTNNP